MDKFVEAIEKQNGDVRMPRDDALARAALQFYGAILAGTAIAPPPPWQVDER